MMPGRRSRHMRDLLSEIAARASDQSSESSIREVAETRSSSDMISTGRLGKPGTDSTVSALASKYPAAYG